MITVAYLRSPAATFDLLITTYYYKNYLVFSNVCQSVPCGFFDASPELAVTIRFCYFTTQNIFNLFMFLARK
jgi:hypothetical protein